VRVRVWHSPCDERSENAPLSLSILLWKRRTLGNNEGGLPANKKNNKIAESPHALWKNIKNAKMPAPPTLETGIRGGSLPSSARNDHFQRKYVYTTAVLLAATSSVVCIHDTNLAVNNDKDSPSIRVTLWLVEDPLCTSSRDQIYCCCYLCHQRQALEVSAKALQVQTKYTRHEVGSLLWSVILTLALSLTVVDSTLRRPKCDITWKNSQITRAGPQST